jgi:hypothetical protein
MPSHERRTRCCFQDGTPNDFSEEKKIQMEIKQMNEFQRNSTGISTGMFFIREM